MKMYLREKSPVVKEPTVAHKWEEYLIDKLLPYEDLGDILPGRFHFNTLDDLAGEYRGNSTDSLHSFDISNRKGSDPTLFGQIIHPENWQVIYPALLEYVRKKDPTKCFSFLQYIRPKGNDKFVWYFSTSQYLKRLDLLFTIDIPLSSMGTFSARALGLVVESNYLKKNCDKLVKLTKREKEILQLIAIGLDNRQMAERLFISRRTVEQHRKNIRRKLEISSVAELYWHALCFS